MSLRIRLVLLIVTLVALVAVALSVLQLSNLVESLTANAVNISNLASQEMLSLLIEGLNQHSDEYASAKTEEDLRVVAYHIISTDGDIRTMLLKTMAVSPDYIIEINVAGSSREILASSDPERVGTTIAPLQDLETWKDRPVRNRFWDLISRRGDYQMVLNGGQHDNKDFSVQVVTSGVLLRTALLDAIRGLALVFGGGLGAVILITVLASNRALRPVKRIEETIDRIAQGSDRAISAGKHLTKEFAVVESKLDLLGQQFRGAREHASELRGDIDKLLERMASQLDVATRLAAISKLGSGVAHEIKNPLNAIALRLDLLRAKLGAPEEELAQEIEVLSKEVMRLNRVVKTFLDFSRPVDVHFEETDLSALAKEVVELMTPQARLSRISLDLDAPGEPVHVRADPDMIKQAILNLVTNAMEAMRDGGNLLVKVHLPDGAAALEVTDSGPGIPEQLRDKVFQLYFTTKSRGSGIGLAMTYRAVQLHNGSIAFTSEEGKGTTFRLQFPAVVRHA
jgi:signal transduction histidine kinase